MTSRVLGPRSIGRGARPAGQQPVGNALSTGADVPERAAAAAGRERRTPYSASAGPGDSYGEDVVRRSDPDTARSSGVKLHGGNSGQ